MADLMYYLKRAVADQASDLFIIAGGPVSEKLEKRLSFVSEGRMLPDETAELIKDLYKHAKRPMDHYMEVGDDDFSFSVPGLARFRVNGSAALWPRWSGLCPSIFRIGRSCTSPRPSWIWRI